MKKIILIIAILIIGSLTIWFYATAQDQAGYYGLPVVACVDPTLPIQQNYTFTLHITASGQNVSLDQNIGHDPGNCLRVIHTDSSSGTVKVTANDSEQYTLGDFFNVWHKQFNAQGFMGYNTNADHHLSVSVNGKSVSTLADTVLKPGENISIIYR